MEKTMKSIVFHEVHRMSLEKTLIPTPDPTQVLFKVKACGICGTDVHMINGVAPGGFPFIPGHECAGEVVAIGSEVKKIKVGDRITVDPNVGCGNCEFCQSGAIHLCKNQKPFGVFSNGGFAEFAVIKETHAYKITDNMTYEEGAMVEPLACCLRGIQMGKIKMGDTVLVIGVGAIGNMILQLARATGATTIIACDPLADRRQLALDMGADFAIDPINEKLPERLKALLPEGPDVIIECAGKTKMVELAVKLVKRGGIVVAFGICPADEYAQISPYYLNDNEITLCGSYNNPHTHAAAIAAIGSRRVRVQPLISHRFSLDQYAEAFDRFGKLGSMKIVICPTK
jgi:2-desacetyl-2-hydroxyethyl bacteriochlorophyllide A dehydrogenase